MPRLVAAAPAPVSMAWGTLAPVRRASKLAVMAMLKGGGQGEQQGQDLQRAHRGNFLWWWRAVRDAS